MTPKRTQPPRPRTPRLRARPTPPVPAADPPKVPVAATPPAPVAAPARAPEPPAAPAVSTREKPSPPPAPPWPKTLETPTPTVVAPPRTPARIAGVEMVKVVLLDLDRTNPTEREIPVTDRHGTRIHCDGATWVHVDEAADGTWRYVRI